jgi:hypothetical protein
MAAAAAAAIASRWRWEFPSRESTATGCTGRMAQVGHMNLCVVVFEKVYLFGLWIYFVFLGFCMQHRAWDFAPAALVLFVVLYDLALLLSDYGDRAHYYLFLRAPLHCCVHVVVPRSFTMQSRDSLLCYKLKYIAFCLSYES